VYDVNKLDEVLLARSPDLAIMLDNTEHFETEESLALL